MTLSALPFPMPVWLPSGSGGPIYHQWNWVYPRDWNVSNPSAAQTLDGALLKMTSRLQFVRPWIVVGKRIQISIKNRGRPKIWPCLIISSTWLVHQQGHLWSLWNGVGCASKKQFLVVGPWLYSQYWIWDLPRWETRKNKSAPPCPETNSSLVKPPGLCRAGHGIEAPRMDMQKGNKMFTQHREVDRQEWGYKLPKVGVKRGKHANMRQQECELRQKLASW